MGKVDCSAPDALDFAAMKATEFMKKLHVIAKNVPILEEILGEMVIIEVVEKPLEVEKPLLIGQRITCNFQLTERVTKKRYKADCFGYIEKLSGSTKKNGSKRLYLMTARPGTLL